jgi:hypothetical protein
MWWIREAPAAVGRNALYMLALRSWQQRFSRKYVKKEFSAADIRRKREQQLEYEESPCFRA